ncbi:MAG: UTP--glucose-1-phosphate uridylyltransferase [Desulfobacterales bacterium]|nr:UTP--glucose-1-phosphate uridylyltransferase [Desulfobacterales bacterium]
MRQPGMIPHLAEFAAKMAKAGLSSLAIDTFAHYYRRLVGGETGLIHDADIFPIQPHEIPKDAELAGYAAAGRRALSRSVRIVLNGGLGTSMGLLGPKSLLKVKQGLSFLQIILRQAELSQCRLAMMNSFNTHTATLSEITKLKPSRPPLFFLQHKFPKILQGELTPAGWPPNRELEWNPPGHGDVYAALFASGMLQKLVEEGVRYAFICNSDNLGAGIDESLLGYFSEKRFPFMMEVAEKTPSDIKGGHLARHRNGRLILREAAQCAKEEIAAFQDIRRYRFFNTNNIWVNLEFLKDLILRHRFVDLPMIVNPKTLDPRDEKSPPVYQIETAMGSGVSLFDGAAAVNVPRARFLPVKTCNDLLAVRSDCFVYSEREGLTLNPARAAAGRTEAIKIKLDSKYYGKFDRLEERFQEGAPSLVECDALTIHGDVRFEKGVVVRGTVTITNPGPAPAVIKAGAVIERDLAL